MRNCDAAIDAAGAREQLEIERAGVGEVAQDGGDASRRLGMALRQLQHIGLGRKCDGFTV